MTTVLKSKREGEVGYWTKSGGRYTFRPQQDKNGVNIKDTSIQIIFDDNDAKELLETYPNELNKVSESNWPERYKKVAKEHLDSRLKEATEAFPELIKEKILGKAKKK